MPKFKLTVNTRLLLSDRLEGIGRYSFEILKRLVKNNPDVEFHFIFDRPYSSDFIFDKNVIPHVVPPQARHPFLYYIWFHFQIPRILKKVNADAFFSPEGYAPLKSNIPVYITIHDLNFFHRKKDLPSLESWYYNTYFPKYSKLAKNIFTVSKYSKSDLINSYQLSSDKIIVTYNGHEHLEKGSNTVDNNQPYFIYIGSLHQRKNIEGLLKSFEKFKTKYNTNHQLIIVGRKMFSSNTIEKTFNSMNHQKDVIFTGFLEQSDLSNYIHGAVALLNLSFYEGFGIPIIEAYKNHIPVIVSNLTSLPEVAGSGGKYFSPDEFEKIADEMFKLSSNTSYRNELIKNGIEQLNNFSWDRSAEIIGKTIFNGRT